MLSQNRYSDYESMETFNETGVVDLLGLLADLDDAYAQVEQNTGVILCEGLLDCTVRAGLSLAGWKPVSELSLRR
jgi:polyamine oxidase